MWGQSVRDACSLFLNLPPLAFIVLCSPSLLAVCLVIGASVGAAIAARIKITSLPQMVAAFHSLVGAAAVTTSISSFLAADPSKHADPVHLTTTLLGTFIGAVTLTGSAVAFGKLHGLLRSAPLSLW